MDQQTQLKVLKSLDSISQNAHMLTGVFIVFLSVIFKISPWYIIPIYVGLVAFKEFYWDQKNEIPEIRGSNWRDFLFYNIGWIGGLALYFISKLIK